MIESESAIHPNNVLTAYFREISQIPLLETEEEKTLFRILDAGKIAATQLTQAVDVSRPEREFLEKQADDGETAKEYLILANLPLAASVAKKYRGLGVPFLDLIQEGNLGLMRAVDKFNSTPENKFSSYATIWIRKAVLDAVTDQGRIIRLPSRTQNPRYLAILKTQARLTKENGQEPTTEEIAQELGLDPKKVRDLLIIGQTPDSLDRPLGDEHDATLADFVQDPRQRDPVKETNQNQLRQDLTGQLESLTPRQTRVLNLRFGLNGGDEMDLTQIAKKFGLSKQRIFQIEQDAFKRLRHPSRTRKLKGYLDK